MSPFVQSVEAVKSQFLSLYVYSLKAVREVGFHHRRCSVRQVVFLWPVVLDGVNDVAF